MSRPASFTPEDIAALAEILSRGDLDGMMSSHAMAQIIAERWQPTSLQQEITRLRDGIVDLAEQWRYKGEFGDGPWQEGYGPDEAGQVLDDASSKLRNLLKETRDE